MEIQSKRMALVCAGVAVCSVLVALTAQAQDVSFEAPWDFPAGNTPVFVAVGDFNGDGLLDLAATNLKSASVSVLLGNGNGSFQAPRIFATGSSPYSVAVATSTATGCRTSLWQTGIPTTSPCFWG